MPNYYNMETRDRVTDIDIYGEVSEYDRWNERNTSAYTLVKRIEELKDVDQINVNINSVGGDVKEGVAIFNALQRHPAKVITRCDGWACSIASVIFMAGDERVMYPTSLLWIHNAWTWASGNAEEFRKQAEDLDTITDSIKQAYRQSITLDEATLTKMMDAETWIGPAEALEWGFATAVEQPKPTAGAQASARRAVFNLAKAPRIDAEAIADALFARMRNETVEIPPEDPVEDPAPIEDPVPEEPETEQAPSNMAANLAAFFMAKN